MLELFANPGYLAVAGALIAVPIVIHLINRLRFKRRRWAAMEFLLKAQKRTRRRLIVEQLLLLAMRCMLVGLLGLLVVRLLNVSPTDLWDLVRGLFNRDAAGQMAADTGANLHVVLLDDTLSTQDGWKDGEGNQKDAFAVAKNDILLERLVKKLGQVRTANRVMVIPLSQLVLKPDAELKIYESLGDAPRLEELQRDVEALEPTALHLDLLQAVKKAEAIFASHSTGRVYLHLISDFRQKDWARPGAEALHKTLLEMCKEHRNLRVRLIDTVYPYRTTLGGYPQSHDNVGIVDLRPSTRIAGKNMPVNFVATLENYSGRDVDVNLAIYDENSGSPIHEAAQSMNPPSPLKLKASTTTTVSFDLRFTPTIKKSESGEPGSYFAHISARLLTAQLQPLPDDGLAEDNTRHAVVEIRDKVPVLIVDGEGAKGRDENKDSFFIEVGLTSVPGASYQLVFGQDIAGGVATKALERPDLHRFPSIFLLNVRELTPKQQANLEAFVQGGGGVAFFMGPAVFPRYYNSKLYSDGKGLFPVPLKDSYYPPPNEEPIPTRASSTPQLLIRDENAAVKSRFPIFGPVFENPKVRENLVDLPVHRYFPVDRSRWRPEPGKVQELATLPNDQTAYAYQAVVMSLVQGPSMKAVLAAPDTAPYRAPIEAHLREIKNLVENPSDVRAYQLGAELTKLLDDRGEDKGKGKDKSANLTEFWSSGDPAVQGLKREIVSLRDQVHYGDPFVIAQNYGKGRVVAVMTTAGKDWNDWGGGSLASPLYPAFIWEMQNYLSSQGSEANQSVGTPIVLNVDAEPYHKNGEALSVETVFQRPQQGKPAEPVKLDAEAARESEGHIVSRFTRTAKPGLYLTQLRRSDAAPDAAPLAAFGNVFNVDTPHEGPLARISSDEMDHDVLQPSEGKIRFDSPDTLEDVLVEVRKDFSESWLLFLIFLCILVAEQALAVHLSFHMKGSENEILTQATRPPAGVA